MENRCRENLAMGDEDYGSKFREQDERDIENWCRENLVMEDEAYGSKLRERADKHARDYEDDLASSEQILMEHEDRRCLFIRSNEL